MAMLVVDLDEALLCAFRKYAVGKHGKIRGVLKPEIELALRKYLEDQDLGSRFHRSDKS
jgi:hypothetical protein